MLIAEELMEVLVCPVSKKPLLYICPADDNDDFLFCPESRLRYRIEAGIPVMLVDEAVQVGEREAAVLVARHAKQH